MNKSLDAVPFISATGRTMLPLRFVAENLGCQLQWESSSQKVTINYAAGSVSQGVGVSTGPSVSGSNQTEVGVPTEPSVSGNNQTGVGVSAGPSVSGNSQMGVGASAGSSLFSGIWKVTDDRGENYNMYLVQNGSQLTGNWDDDEVITGTISGNKFTGKYYKGGYPETKWNVNMTVVSEGQGFTGSYSYSTWTSAMVGVKDNTATDKINIPPTPGAPDADFSGTWDIWLYQPMVLIQSGDQVSGTWGDKTVTGVVTGNVLNGKYYKTSDPTMFWGFNLKMNSDGQSLTGWHTLRGGKEFTGKKK